MVRTAIKNLDEARQQSSKRRLEDTCNECISIEPHSHDAYAPTAAQMSSWAGTIHADHAENHRQIDAQSRTPHTRAALAKELLRIHQDNEIQTKDDALIEIMSFKQPVEELRVISAKDNEKFVLRELKTACLTPICFSQSLNRTLSIQDLVRRLSRNRGAEMNVYDPSVQDYADTTRKTTVEEFAKSFSEHSEIAIPKNFLDISNSTGLQYLPQSVLDVCLETRCKPSVKSLGKDLEDVKAHPEFFIATKKGGISPTHVDNFGKATCVIMLEGTKCWYIPSGDPWAIRRDHRAGEISPGSRQLKIKLDVGTVFIHLPGQVHAVWSQTDCLLVGAHFYTAATFAASLDCVCEQLTKGIHSNDDATSKDWITLTTIIQFLDDEEVFTEKESGHAYDSLENLINHPELQSFWKNSPDPSTRAAIKKFHSKARALLKEKSAQES